MVQVFVPAAPPRVPSIAIRPRPTGAIQSTKSSPVVDEAISDRVVLEWRGKCKKEKRSLNFRKNTSHLRHALECQIGPGHR
jgi:hypothetical protein